MVNKQKIIAEFLDMFASIINIEVSKAVSQLNQKQDIEIEEYLTKPQVAEFFQVTQRTVDNWVKARLFNSYGIGNLVRFKRKEVQDAFTKISA